MKGSINLSSDVKSVTLAHGDCALIFRAGGETEIHIQGNEEDEGSEGAENLLLCAAVLHEPALREQAARFVSEDWERTEKEEKADVQ